MKRDMLDERVVLFEERRECWSPGPAPTLWEAWTAIAAECSVVIKMEVNRSDD